ncbi:MAG: hypothetical protein HRT87_05395 [Legionellales bacterium]|nr:hypothetical protein [Legionellales bacterium]
MMVENTALDYNSSSERLTEQELQDIEEHLKKLYMKKLTELSKQYYLSADFLRVVEAPLCVAAMYYCKGGKEKAVEVLNITRWRLNHKLSMYYGKTDIKKSELSEYDNRMCLLYESYLDQVLVDGLSDKFTKMVYRAMYAVVMEFSSSISEASRILGVTKHMLEKNLVKYFGDKRGFVLGDCS